MKKLKMGSLAAVSILMFLGGCALAAQTVSAIPDTPAGNKVKESLAVIDSGDTARIREFISTQFMPSFIEMFGKDRLFQVYYGFFEVFGGLEFHKAQESSARKLEGVFRCRRTGSAFTFGLSVLPKPPHQIHGMTLLPMTDPDQPESLAPLTEKERAGRLESFLEILGKSEAFSGVVLWAKNGKIISQKACGIEDREKGLPNRVVTRFNLASINKMFTAVAIAQLAEQGKLSYEDPVSKFLGPDWLPEKIANKVRIKHLLSHTSGIGIGGEDDNLVYIDKMVEKGIRRIDQFKDLVQKAFAKSAPGKKHAYSNFGFHLLGAIIEKAGGQDYYDYIQTHIFTPAGMTGAGFDELDKLAPGTARGYVKELKDGRVSWRSNASDCNWKGTPAGGSYSTAGDLLKFEQALKNDVLISRKTRDLLFTAQTELGSPAYGYGFSVRSNRGHVKVGHTGGYTGINNQFSMYLDNGHTVLILSNVDLISGSPDSAIEFFINGLFF